MSRPLEKALILKEILGVKLPGIELLFESWADTLWSSLFETSKTLIETGWLYTSKCEERKHTKSKHQLIPHDKTSVFFGPNSMFQMNSLFSN